MSEKTPAFVAANATRPEVLALGSLTVIGVMRAHDGHAAILRSARGRIARVQTGEQVFGVTVTAIGDNHVILADRSGQTQTVGVPGS